MLSQGFLRKYSSRYISMCSPAIPLEFPIGITPEILSKIFSSILPMVVAQSFPKNPSEILTGIFYKVHQRLRLRMDTRFSFKITTGMCLKISSAIYQENVAEIHT